MNRPLLIKFAVLTGLVSSCAIQVHVTSSRTALERQILGRLEPVPQEILPLLSVRGDEDQVPSGFQLAQLEQQYLADDLEELRAMEIIGEREDGFPEVLPDEIRGAADATDLRLAEIVVAEERDIRLRLWNLHPDGGDLPTLRKAYASQILASSPLGLWFFNPTIGWYQKR